jgi:hypothetical protein
MLDMYGHGRWACALQLKEKIQALVALEG